MDLQRHELSASPRSWSAPGARRGEDGTRKEAEVRDALRQLGPFWGLFRTEQARIVQLLVERVEIAEDGLDIRFRTDRLAGLVREFGVDARAAA